MAAEAGDPELLGVIYVVGGSRMGGLVLVRHLAEGLGLPPGPGLLYHLEGAEGFPRAWRGVCGRLDGALAGEGEVARFVGAARRTMEEFFGLYGALGRELLGEGAR